MTGEQDTHNGFIITGKQKKSRYILSGRALVEGDDLAIYLDDYGRVPVPTRKVRYLILLGGSLSEQTPDGGSWIAERRDGGRGLWITRDDNRFVIPARSLVPVLEGKARKAPVFRWEGEAYGLG